MILMNKGKLAEKIIRSITERYNSVAAQWNKCVYLMLKGKHQMKKNILSFIHLLIN